MSDHKITQYTVRVWRDGDRFLGSVICEHCGADVSAKNKTVEQVIIDHCKRCEAVR